MAYNSTNDENSLFGYNDAPSSVKIYPTHVLAEGIVGLGATVPIPSTYFPNNSLFSEEDIDVYSLGTLYAGTYKLDLDQHTWNYNLSNNYIYLSEFGVTDKNYWNDFGKNSPRSWMLDK